MSMSHCFTLFVNLRNFKTSLRNFEILRVQFANLWPKPNPTVMLTLTLAKSWSIISKLQDWQIALHLYHWNKSTKVTCNWGYYLFFAVADAGLSVLLCTVLCGGYLFFAGSWLSVNARLGVDIRRSCGSGNIPHCVTDVTISKCLGFAAVWHIIRIV